MYWQIFYISASYSTAWRNFGHKCQENNIKNKSRSKEMASLVLPPSHPLFYISLLQHQFFFPFVNSLFPRSSSSADGHCGCRVSILSLGFGLPLRPVQQFQDKIFLQGVMVQPLLASTFFILFWSKCFARKWCGYDRATLLQISSLFHCKKPHTLCISETQLYSALLHLLASPVTF